MTCCFCPDEPAENFCIECDPENFCIECDLGFCDECGCPEQGLCCECLSFREDEEDDR